MIWQRSTSTRLHGGANSLLKCKPMVTSGPLRQHLTKHGASKMRIPKPSNAMVLDDVAKIIFDMTTATPSQREACREILAAFEHDIPPELQPTLEEVAAEKTPYLKATETTALLAELVDAS